MIAITYFALAFAGMLIGYFIWYRDRSEDEVVFRKLTRENEDLRTSLKLAHNSYTQLDGRFTRQKGQLNVLQQLCDDWSTSRENAERDRAILESEVSDKTRRYEEAISELQDEKAKRIALEDETHLLSQQQIEKLSLMEEDWRGRHSAIESSLIHHQADLKSTTGEKERLTEQLHAAESRVAELQSDLATQKSLLDTATKNASGLEQEYVSAESSLKESSELLKQARSECAAAQSAQKVAEDTIADLQAEQSKTKLAMEELRSSVANMESLESQVVSLQKSLANSTEQLEKVSSQRDEAIAAEKSSLEVVAGLQKRIDNQENTIHALRAKHEDGMNNLKLELKRRSEIETDFEAKSAELEALLAQQTQEMEQKTGALSTSFERERTELQNKIEAQTKAIEQLAQFEAKSVELEDLLALQVQEMEQKTDSLSTTFEQERTELKNLVEAKSNTINQLTQLRDELNNELADTQGRLKRLAAEHSELETSLASRSHSITELTNLHDTTRVELVDANTRLAKLAGEREVFQSTTAKHAQTIAELTVERDGIRAELSAAKERLEMLNAELDVSNARASELTDKVEELKMTCQRISELESLVKDRDQEDQQVVNELRTVREQYAEAYQKQLELQDELARVTSEHARMSVETNRNDNQLQMLTMKLKASEETIRKLRRERAAVLARLANYRTIAEPDATVISFTEAMAQRQQSEVNFDREYGGTTSQHAVRGLVYTEAPKKRDDLKLISGIAQVLEARLNDYGIYTFKQIMEWTPEAVEEFSRLLTFKDRIERDDWISQARQFYEQKYRSVAA